MLGNKADIFLTFLRRSLSYSESKSATHKVERQLLQLAGIFKHSFVNEEVGRLHLTLSINGP